MKARKRGQESGNRDGNNEDARCRIYAHALAILRGSYDVNWKNHGMGSLTPAEKRRHHKNHATCVEVRQQEQHEEGGSYVKAGRKKFYPHGAVDWL